MALYNNTSQKSVIDSVEFAPVPEGNISFVRLKEGADVEGAKQLLSKQMGQEIEAQALSGKQTILVTRGDKAQADIVKSFAENDVQLKPAPEPKKKIDMWKARGALSMIGHPMQLVSGVLAKGLDVATIGFAASNLLANLTNYAFGAEKKTDPHHLRFIKTEVNKIVTPFVPDGTQLPDPDDKRAPLHQDPDSPPGIGQKFHNFMARHSVMFGEIGLRYIGGISLVVPFLRDAEINGDSVKINGQKAVIEKDGTVKIGGTPYKPVKNAAGDTILEGFELKSLEINGKPVSIEAKLLNEGGREILGVPVRTRTKQLGVDVDKMNNVTKLTLDGKAVKGGGHWKAALGDLTHGKFSEALSKVRNVDKFTLYAGTFWLAGKTVAFASKVPDPYNPDQPDDNTLKGKIQNIREKYLFKISTTTEAIGATTMAYDRFFRRKITIPTSWKFIPAQVSDSTLIPEKIPSWKPYEAKVGNEMRPIKSSEMSLWKKETKIGDEMVKIDLPFWKRAARVITGDNLPGLELRGMKLRGIEKTGEEFSKIKVPDFIGGTGALLFALAFVMRFNAPFGVREVNMDEVDAHVADSLAKVPPAKLPQAVAETAAFLTDHFKEKKLNYGEVYSKLATDLYHDHNIALPGADGGQGAAATPLTAEAKNTPDAAQAPAKVFAKPELKKASIASMARPEHFRDRISPIMESEALGP